METYVITGIRKGASALSAKLNRNGYDARVYKKTNVVATGTRRPWAILNGYMTNDSQIVPVRDDKESIDNAVSRYGI